MSTISDIGTRAWILIFDGVLLMDGSITKEDANFRTMDVKRLSGLMKNGALKISLQTILIAFITTNMVFH